MCVQVGEGKSERGKERESQDLMWGSKPQTMRSQPEGKLDAYLTEPPRNPCFIVSISFIPALFMFSFFLSVWVLFVLFLVPLGVKLDCLTLSS